MIAQDAVEFAIRMRESGVNSPWLRRGLPTCQWQLDYLITVLSSGAALSLRRPQLRRQR